MKECSKGRGVFAVAAIPAGSTVLIFHGPLLSREEVKDFSHSLQVSDSTWLGPSGHIDDDVNHSCSPNCGLRSVQVDGDTEPQGACLFALRDIGEGEEVTFDYSTSMLNEPWLLERCTCGAPACRTVVGDFLTLPEELRESYAAVGGLPEHTRRVHLQAKAGSGRSRGSSVVETERGMQAEASSCGIAAGAGELPPLSCQQPALSVSQAAAGKH